MKVPVGLGVSQDVPGSSKLVHPGDRAFESKYEVRIDHRYGPAGHLRLQEASCQVNLLQLLQRERDHGVAAVRLVGDLPLGLQDLECFPNRHPADVQALRELLLAHPLPRLQLARHDGTPDLPENRFLGGGRSAVARAGFLVEHLLPGWSYSPALASGRLMLTEGRNAGQGMAQDLGMHLARALVGEDALQVVRVPQRRVVERDAVSPEDGPRLPGYLDGLPHVVELAGGDVLGAYGPLVLHAPDVQREQRTLLYLEHHVHELLLRELEPGYGLAELLAPSGVLQRRLIAVPRRTHRAPDDAVAGLAEAGERPAQPLRLREHRSFGEPDVLQGQ